MVKVLENVLNINGFPTPVLILVLLSKMLFLMKVYVLVGTNFSELLSLVVFSTLKIIVAFN